NWRFASGSPPFYEVLPGQFSPSGILCEAHLASPCHCQAQPDLTGRQRQMIDWPRTARRRRVSSSRAINHTARWYTWLCLIFGCLRFCFVFVVLILSHSLNHTPIHLPLRYLSHYTRHPDHTHTIIKRGECGQD